MAGFHQKEEIVRKSQIFQSLAKIFQKIFLEYLQFSTVVSAAGHGLHGTGDAKILGNI